MMQFIKKRPLLILSGLLFFLSLFIRYRIRGLTNIDTQIIGGWYEHLLENGFAGLSDGTFSNYPPAYLYFLWFTTLLSNWVGPLVSIKLIPTLFDLLSALAVFLLARMKFKGDIPYLLAAGFFLLPTVMLNSTGWGQIESLYTSFLLLCLYLLLTDRPFWAMAAFGIAFSFKAQSIFLLPFLGIMLLWGRMRWYHFLIVPLMYVTLALPVTLTGRSWESIFTLYFGQVGQFEEIAKTAPNLYIFIPLEYYHPVLEIGLTAFVIVMGLWAWVNWKAEPPHGQRRILLAALASVALVPFLLPKMHDRYFYPADALSFVTAIFLPELWFLPVLFQISSGFAYTIFLFDMSPMFVYIAAILNTMLIPAIVYIQLKSLKDA